MIRIDVLYLSKYENIKVLGANFLGKYNVVVFEVEEVEKGFRIRQVFVLIENIEKSILIDLKVFANPSGYIVFNVSRLFKEIPKTLRKLLIRKGLFQKEKSSNISSVHRLVTCMYDDIIGLDVHHIEKDKSSNDITSIMPLDPKINKKIDNLSFNRIVQESRKLQKEWIAKLNQKERTTLASNEELILGVLKLSENTDVKTIMKTIKNKICESKIYEILSLYFYKDGFLKWVESTSIKSFSELNGKFIERWEKFIQFEELKTQNP